MRRVLPVALVAVGLVLALVPATPARADAPGTTWQREAWTGMLMNSVTYGNPNGQPTFVSVSPFVGPARVWSSSDGVNWNSRTTSLDSVGWQGVAYGSGRFVAVTNDAKAAWSTDGITWNASSIGSGAAMAFAEISFVNGQFMAVGNAVVNQGTDRPMVATSPDGVTWTTTNILGSTYSAWREAAYGNGRYVIVAPVAGGGKTASSVDGTTWTQAPSTNDTARWESVQFFKGRFIAVGWDSNAMTSTDGQTWTAVSLPVPGKRMWALAHDGNTIVAFGDDVIFTSTDGLTWTAATPPASGVFWQVVTAGNGAFVGWGRAGGTSYLITSGIAGSGATTSDPASWLRVEQALPAGAGGRCEGLNDEAVAYGTGLRGGWSPTWQEWSGPACTRTLANRGTGWFIE